MEDPQHRHSASHGSTFGGILHKKGAIKWEKRFFMIEHGELKWFKNLSISATGQLKPAGKEFFVCDIAGSITVKNCPCGPSKGKNKEDFAFQLATLRYSFSHFLSRKMQQSSCSSCRKSTRFSALERSSKKEWSNME